MAMLQCVTCDEQQAVPKHCGQEMQIQEVDGRQMLVCWMGPGCGSAEIPLHHDAPMRMSA